MRIFLPTLTRVHFLYLSSPNAALASSSADAGKVDREGASDIITKANSWTSFLNPSRVLEGLQNAYNPPALPSIGTASELPPSDFWDKAKELEKTLQEYVPRLLGSAAEYFDTSALTDVVSSMNSIVKTTTTFRESIQSALDARNVTLDTLAEELEDIFAGIVRGLQNNHSPDDVPSHAERAAMVDEITATGLGTQDRPDAPPASCTQVTEMVDKVLGNTESALVDLATRYGIEEDIVTTYMRAVGPYIQALMRAICHINARFPQLFSAIAFSVAAMLIPEIWILKPLLGMLGFGPAGPIKGMAAAWLQRYFWGGAVGAGSWFALLQAAGMGVIPAWAGFIIKGPLVLGSLVAAFFKSRG